MDRRSVCMINWRYRRPSNRADNIGGLHWRNFTLKSGGDQWRRQDLRSGGHDDRGAEGARIEAPKTPSGVGYREGCPLPSRLRGLGERHELPQRGPGRSPSRYRIFCILLTQC